MTEAGKTWQNRIIGYAEVPPSLLLANDLNWRMHPEDQKGALSAIIRKIGLVQNVVVNARDRTFDLAAADEEADDIVNFIRTCGTSPQVERVHLNGPVLLDGHLRCELAQTEGQPLLPVTFDLAAADEEADDIVNFIRTSGDVPQVERVHLNGPVLLDGHLRCELAQSEGQPLLPVTFVQISEEEEAEILATLDPISTLAQIDTERLRLLHERLSVEDEHVQMLLADLADRAGLFSTNFTPMETEAHYADNPYADKEYFVRKQVTVMFSMEDNAAFNEAMTRLARHYTTGGLAETLLQTVTDAAATIPEPHVLPRREKPTKELKPPTAKKAKDLPTLTPPAAKGKQVATTAPEPAPQTDFFSDEAASIPELV